MKPGDTSWWLDRVAWAVGLINKALADAYRSALEPRYRVKKGRGQRRNRRNRPCR